MVNKKQVVSVLKKCYDPEISMNVVDLGLIHDVKINGGNVSIKMGLTSPNCPLRSLILEDIKNKVSKIKGVKKVDIDLVFEPWSLDRVSKKIKKKMGWL
ncbi:MAG: iron-sulfur cluster assembly protein [Candidatus Aenigmatarchaeota archaeon]